MKTVQVNGETYEVRALHENDIAPGMMVCGDSVRKAYRILMSDEGEWIMRNMRHPEIVDVATTEWLMANCNRIEPASE